MILQFFDCTSALVHLERGDLDVAGLEVQKLLEETQRRSATALEASNNARTVNLLRERDQLAVAAGMIAVLRQQPTILIDAVTVDLADAMITAHTADAGAGTYAIDAALTHDLERYSRNWGGSGMAMCCTLADAAALVDHRRAGERLLPIVATVADRNVVLGMPPPVAFGWGSHYLGVCQLLVGAIDDAALSLADALEHNAAMGALPYVARTRLALARVALARDDGDGAVAHAVGGATTSPNGPGWPRCYGRPRRRWSRSVVRVRGLAAPEPQRRLCSPTSSGPPRGPRRRATKRGANRSTRTRHTCARWQSATAAGL